MIKNIALSLLIFLFAVACSPFSDDEDLVKIVGLKSQIDSDLSGLKFPTVTPTVTQVAIEDDETEDQDVITVLAKFDVIGSGWSFQNTKAYWVDLLFEGNSRLPNESYLLFTLQAFEPRKGTVNISLLEQVLCQEVSCSATLYFEVERGFVPIRLIHSDGRTWSIDAPVRPDLKTPTPSPTSVPSVSPSPTATQPTVTPITSTTPVAAE
jgi:hypothetical protein